MEANFEPDISQDNPVLYSKAKYKVDSKVNEDDGVTEGYYSKSKRLPIHTDMDISAVNDTG